MREIIFRGKESNSNEWVYGSLAENSNGLRFIVGDVEKNCFDGENTDLIVAEWYEVDHKTIGQYTGMTDKNGTEIYEGDIVTACDFWSDKYGGHCPDTYVKGVVEFDCGMCVVKMGKDKAWELWELRVNDDELEIIGNMYDNPELLKEI